MRPEQEDLFCFRSKSNGHVGGIVNQNIGNKTEEVFRRLTKRIFSHHIVSLPYKQEPEWPSHYNDHDLPPRPCITNLFHNEFYAPVTISRGFHGKDIELERFFEVITRNTDSETSNNVNFLIGNVGVGKSSFISNILIKYGRNWVEDLNIIPVRVDLDINSGHMIPTKQQILFILYDSIIKAYQELDIMEKEYLDIIYDETSVNKEETTYKCECKLKALVSKLREVSPKRVLLIIDNLDYIYHAHDRGLFAMQTGERGLTEDQEKLVKERDRAHQIINYIIRVFIDKQALGGVGINVLTVMRRDSLVHYNNITRINVPTEFDMKMHTYEIKPPSMEEVINSHVRLLYATIDRLPESTRNDVFKKAAEALFFSKETNKRVNKEKNKLNRELQMLSKQGFRQIISHLSYFIWTPIGIEEQGDIYNLKKRFQDQYTPSLLAFILNGHRLFSQFQSQFTNIYLVRSDCGEVDYEIAWGNLLVPHKHTYWLKRLLLAYILCHCCPR